MFTITVLQALRWSGLGIWGALLLSVFGAEGPAPSPLRLVLAVAAGAAYLLSFWRATDFRASHLVRRRWTLGLSVSALGLHALFTHHPLVGALLVAVAGVLPMQWTPGPTLGWVVVQTGLLLLVLGPSLGWPGALDDALWSLGLQGALALVMLLVFQNLQVRREWSNHAAHLQRRALEAERTRIARDLHDLLGHDLALLSAELEYARRCPGDEAREAVGRAHHIASRLFDGVRGSVGSLRHAPGNWSEVLRPLEVSVPGLRLHVVLPPSTPAPGGAALSALAMVVQEALTNTVRHAGATNFFVEVRHEDDTVVVSVRDDGQARRPLVPGHGLLGMRERLEDVGGTLTVRTLDLGAVQVQASVPLGDRA